MLYGLADIEALVAPQLFDDGWQWFTDGRVTAPSVLRGGEVVAAIIRRSGGRPLRVYIRARTQGDELTIQGDCTCARRTNCEHVVAVLLQALQERGELASGPDTAGRLTSAKRETQSTFDLRQRSQPAQALLFALIVDDEQTLVETVVARRLKNGRYTPGQPFDPRSVQRGLPPRFLEPVDLDLLSALERLPRSYADNTLLQGPGSGPLLQSLLATGRLQLLDEGNQLRPLREGPGRPVDLQWVVDETGTQYIRGTTEPPCDQLLQLSAGWYLDVKRGQCGPLESELPATALGSLLAWPPVAPQHAARAGRALTGKFSGVAIPLPQCFEIETVSDCRPVPHLCLKTQMLDWEGFVREDDCARLRFDYGAVELDPAGADTQLADHRVVCVQRDRKAERAAARLLQKAGLTLNAVAASLDQGTCYRLDADDAFEHAEAWLDFQSDVLPILREQGWRITYENFALRLSEPASWNCAVERLDERGWFSLSMDVEVEGQHVELLPILLHALRELPRDVLQHEAVPTQALVLPWTDPQGRPGFLHLPAARVWPLLQILLELHQEAPTRKDAPLRLSRWQLARLAVLDAPDADGGEPSQWQWLGDPEARALLHRLRNIETIPTVPAPAGLQAILRPYQQAGLDWLQFLREFRFAGILADDMGLGKTLQALAHLLLEKEAGRADRPSLVVAPTSLMFNWLHEARRFAPGLKVLVLQGPDRGERFAQIGEHDLVLTTYPLLSRDRQRLLAQRYHLLILDEAQFIKNPRAQASQVVRELDARHRLCLTGTPMENHLGELWSLFDVLLPGLLGGSKSFKRQFRTPIEKHGSEAAAQRLHRRIRPFLLRRTKQAVAAELPDKTEIVQQVVLQGAQRELYETVRLAMHSRVREEIARQGLARSQIVVLDALLKLRQVCCDPRLLDSGNARAVGSSAKLDMLLQMLPELVEEGRRILLFSQFTTMLGLIEAAVRRAGVDYVKLTGRTRDRQTPVQRFQRGDVPLFLISLKAGGVGLNLTAADTVIHYDPWWNPAVERQATDRAHRIGQRQRVFVYKLICADTVEEKIQLMQQRKQALAEGLYDEGGNREVQWRDEDLEAVFGPLSTV
ncbi:MAG: hypothetical protein KDI16_00725 [Halioglobus sp.]|nr:hypothetical protein [Halioglobus sp.]